MKRRSFFKLLAGGAVVAAMPSLALNLSNIPTIWADGKHDDSEGLQALIDGKEVEFKNPELTRGMGWRDNVLHLGGATFLTKNTITFDEQFSGKTLKDASIKCQHDGPAIHIKVSPKATPKPSILPAC